jgi:hypothetical protein
MSQAENIRQKIVEAIKGEEDLNNMVVEIDTNVEGKTASYPVDLYLTCTADNGLNYKILIQTKTAGQTLEKSDLFHFANILQDVQGQVLGVIFTQPIYDKVVQSVAKDVGIMLYEVQAEDKIVWEPAVSDIKIDVDKEWVRAEKEKHQLGEVPIQSGGNPKYMFLYDEQDLCVNTIEGIFDQYIKDATVKGDYKTAAIQHQFTGSAIYLHTEHEVIKRVKLNSISFTINFRKLSTMDGLDMVKNILRTALRAQLS